tara:strand:- start:841 stop:1080 length:240 start_codon:yes stop_codon:yes gene_type:complete
MIKVFMAIIITSMPGWESVRYQGFLYPDLQTCETSTELYVQEYKNYAQSEGNTDAYFESICFEISSYPIAKYNNLKLGI